MMEVLLWGILLSFGLPLGIVLFASWMMVLIQLAFVIFNKLEAWGGKDRGSNQ